jgi:hypothetical protein
MVIFGFSLVENGSLDPGDLFRSNYCKDRIQQHPKNPMVVICTGTGNFNSTVIFLNT